MAIAFGRFVNLQKGEGDELTKAAGKLFTSIQENQTLSIPTFVFIMCKHKIIEWLRFHAVA